jgi:hypothetical protein
MGVRFLAEYLTNCRLPWLARNHWLSQVGVRFLAEYLTNCRLPWSAGTLAVSGRCEISGRPVKLSLFL